MRRLLVALVLTLALLGMEQTPVRAAQTPVRVRMGWSIAQTAVSYTGASYYGVGQCTGLVHLVFARYGFWTPYDVPSINYRYQHIASWAIQPGDVLIFANTEGLGLSHVAIYIGGGYFVSADNPYAGVREHYLFDGPYGYWSSHWWATVRIIP